ALVQQMITLSKDRKEYIVLRSIPGIGDSTACRLIGEMGDIRRFQNAKQLNASINRGIHSIMIVLIKEVTNTCESFYILWCVP
ncbi:transposase, partial [Ureibacillus thermosphaericus]|uniref:transposase n=1 Tax=Ureibacillus thermosphaericus TaxID=51173 RepID=UPI000593D3BF